MLGFFEKLLDPFPSDRADTPPDGLIAFCRYYTRDATGYLILLALLTAAIGVGEVMLFGFLGSVVDWLASADRESFLAQEGRQLAVMGFVVLVLLPVLGVIHSLVMHQTLLGNMPMSARWRMHRLLLGQSMSFFANEFAGRVATKVMQTSLAVREAVTKILDVFVYVVVYFLSTLVLVAAADLRIAAVLGVWLAVYIYMIWYFVPRLRQISEKQADARSLMTGRIVDSYTNIGTVKLFAHAGHEETYARAGMKGFLDTVHPQMRLVTLFQAAVEFNNYITIFAVAGLSISFWLAGSMSVGAVAVAVALALRLNGMSHWIMWEVSGLFENIGTIYDGKAMLTKRTEITDAGEASVIASASGAIAFENIRFHYGKKGGVIDDLALTIAPGEKVGLVGRSGAGKSTLVNLLLRLYDVEGGSVKVDGKDVKSLTQHSLRANIGVVTQDTALLHRSLRENIAYGRPDATDEEIVRAAERANAMDFILDLKDQKGRQGLNAHVGERGVRLSGGQRQRIAIARVFLKDAPILVLDEATSALDSEVEAAIQDNLFALMDGKTVIAIAHRLSTIAQLDRLVVIDQGSIIQEGTHSELIDKEGLYQELWTRQTGGFLTGGADLSGAATAAE
ncbi:MAG: ABC transporter ATP-binding protein [Pseudomonadota bacterium]